MLGLGWEATQLIAADLRQTSELMPLPPRRRTIIPIPK